MSALAEERDTQIILDGLEILRFVFSSVKYCRPIAIILSLIGTFLKVTVSVMLGIPLALHETMQLTQPSNTTPELQRLYNVVYENPVEGPFRQWKARDSQALEPLDNHPWTEGIHPRNDPSSEWTRIFPVYFQVR